ncbi:MAG: NifB/NifX family molybdenum-iron cluster-binding protein, partial [Candidatus Aminicenantes bacterium]|nr:NifB/NifX family molybdenum-iron cluster-binding protein [Candidatus Aminicenantes bacterium]
ASGEGQNAWPPEGDVWVSATGPDLEAEIEPHFGHARYFLLVNTATLEFEAVVNPHSEAAHGAGFKSAQLIANRPASAVLTGQVGPKALQILETAGIRVIALEKSNIREAISRLKRR